MAVNRKFDIVQQRVKEIHAKKSADYAKGSNPFSNFEQAAATAGVTVGAVFRTMIAIKLARLAELDQPGKHPLNESVRDSLLDLATYSTLYASFFEEDPPQKVNYEITYAGDDK
jgi:hypothetical protein